MNEGALALKLATNAVRHKYRDDRDRDDLTQEVALHTLGVILAQPDKPQAFYWGVAKQALRQVNSHDRRWTGMPKRSSFYKDPLRQGIAGLTDDALDGKDPATAYTDPELNAAEWRTLRPRIEHAINQLPGDKTRRIVRLIYFAGMTASEAGKASGTTAGSGRALWNTAKQQLAAELDDLRGLVAA